jgi:hypothetical protein
MMDARTRPRRTEEDEVPLFRRRRDDADEPDDVLDTDDYDDAVDDDEDTAEPGQRAEPARPTGPWDVTDVDDDLDRLDLGALHVPVPDGCEVRVDVQDEQVVAATLVDGRSALQIHAFAAPRSSGIWDDVRREIADSLRGSGGSSEEVDGPFGPELRARIPAPDEGQGTQLQPARFIGVDGPRWFLRGLMTGAASTDPVQARVLEQAFRDVVVIRGGEAMAPRDLLPLRLPKEAMAHLAEAQQGEEQPEPPARPTLETLERGPEITETR